MAEQEFQRGDKVLVGDREERIFVAKIEGTEFPYACVWRADESFFKKKGTFRVEFFKECNPIPLRLYLNMDSCAAVNPSYSGLSQYNYQSSLGDLHFSGQRPLGIIQRAFLWLLIGLRKEKELKWTIKGKEKRNGRTTERKI